MTTALRTMREQLTYNGIRSSKSRRSIILPTTVQAHFLPRANPPKLPLSRPSGLKRLPLESQAVSMPEARASHARCWPGRGEARGGVGWDFEQAKSDKDTSEQDQPIGRKQQDDPYLWLDAMLPLDADLLATAHVGQLLPASALRPSTNRSSDVPHYHMVSFSSLVNDMRKATCLHA
jgi:hypothetical protein